MTDEAAKTRGVLMEIVDAQREQMDEDGRPLLQYVLSPAAMRQLVKELAPGDRRLEEMPDEIGLQLPGQNETCSVIMWPPRRKIS